MTWREVLNSKEEYVTVESYGYTERSLVSSHFEPFAHKRQIKFKIDRDFEMLYNKTFWLDDLEENLDYIKREDGIYLNDPGISSKP